MTVATGAAETVVVTNLDMGKSATVQSRGARTRQMTSGGTTTYEHTGNLLLVLFSTDDGGGELPIPSTTLIAGRTVFTVDNATGLFTVQSVSGRTTDLCAALATV